MEPIKKLVKIFHIVLFSSIFLLSCSKTDKDKIESQKQSGQTSMNKPDTIALKDAKYVCPMHPLERSMAPGKCSICRMNLVPVADLNKEMAEKNEKLRKKYAANKDVVYFTVGLPVIKSDECIPILESALSKDAGVMDYNVDILNRTIYTFISKSKTNENKVEQLIADAGFDANNTKANPRAVSNLPAGCK